jgi:hypothetical protein
MLKDELHARDKAVTEYVMLSILESQVKPVKLIGSQKIQGETG